METTASVACPKCFTALPQGVLLQNSGDEGCVCPACRATLYTSTYPRLWKGSDSDGPSHKATISGEGDAVCRFYPELKAETVCDECGSFLSDKAAVTWNSCTYCLPCLHVLREKKGSDEFLARRSLYDNTALGLVLFLSPLS